MNYVNRNNARQSKTKDPDWWFSLVKYLKCQLLWINWDYLHTLSYIFWAEGHRRVWLYWWLFWKDFTFLRTPGPSIWRWASGFHKPRGWVCPGWLHSIESNPATKKLRSRTRLCPPPGPALLSQPAELELQQEQMENIETP